MTEQETSTTTDMTGMNQAPVLQEKAGHKPGTFVPGDKRINRRGRPKSFRQLRERVLVFLSEQDDRAGGTRLEAILRQLAADDPKTLLEYGFGKVPSGVEMAGTDSEKIQFVVRLRPDELP